MSSDAYRQHCDRRVSSRVVRRAMLAYLGLSLLALVAIVYGIYEASCALARADALRDAEHTGTAIADRVVGPLLADVLNGEPRQIDELNHAVAERLQDGSILRIEVWDSSGKLLYVDDARLIGRSFPLPDDAARAITDNTSSVQIEEASEIPELALHKQGKSRPCVEVYVPVQLDANTRVAFAAYFDYQPLETKVERLAREFIPLVVAGIILLQMVQVPIAYSLARRLSRNQIERDRLLRRALTASEQERRRIARDLHDGVVQDLAGSSYALAAIEKSLPESQRQPVRMIGAALQDAVASLRGVMAEIYPPDLAGGGLAKAVADLAEPLRDDGVDVRLRLDIPDGLPAPVVAVLYRLARETLRNVAEHSGATSVDVVVSHASGEVHLRVDDNGVGLPSSGIDRLAEGHLGLRLLADSVADLGGTFSATNREEGGASIRVSLPTESTDEQFRAVTAVR
jgi:two-component system, NarL family, sensor kinase